MTTDEGEVLEATRQPEGTSKDELLAEDEEPGDPLLAGTMEHQQ